MVGVTNPWDKWPEMQPMRVIPVMQMYEQYVDSEQAFDCEECDTHVDPSSIKHMPEPQATMHVNLAPINRVRSRRSSRHIKHISGLRECACMVHIPRLVIQPSELQGQKQLDVHIHTKWTHISKS